MKLSILLTTYNRRELLARTFPTLLQQDLPPEQYEIVVVVDGSTDGSAELLRRMPARCAVHIIEQSNAGQVAAQNVGLKAARGEIVLFTDDEVLFSPGVAREHVAAHAQGGPHAVFGPVKLAAESPDSIASNWTGRWFNNYLEEPDGSPVARPEYLQVATVSPNTSVPRAELLACGGFDERFGYAQDLELGLRLRERGVRPFFKPGAVAHQISVKTDSELVRKDAVRQARDYVRLARRHPGHRGNLPLAQLVEGSAVKQMLLRASASFPAATDALLRVPYWTAERLRAIPAVRRAGLRLLDHRRQVMMLHGAMAEAGSWSALQTEFGLRLPVLLYHHVGPQRTGTNPALTVLPREFEEQIRWLGENGFTGITPSQWLAWREQGTRLPPRPVLLTFDDAYTDLDEHALPVLRRHGFGAAVFVVTACVGKKSRWDKPAGWAAHDCMPEERIRYWAGQGMEFGAHGHTHADLTRLPEAEMVRELERSAQELERILGRKPVAFAYPFGRYNDTVRARVSERFGMSFTIEPGINTLSTDLCRLRRSWVFSGDTRLDLRGLVLWGKSPVRGLAPGALAFSGGEPGCCAVAANHDREAILMPVEVSIIIPTRDRRELLARTLPTVLQQDFAPDRYEVIVAVDGAEDDTLGLLKKLLGPAALRVLDLPHRGRAAALNAAVEEARGRVVLFLDDDLLCSPSLVREHWQAHAQGEDIAVLGPVLPAEESGAGLAAELRRQGLINYFQGIAQLREPAPLPVGHANSSVARSRLLAMGGFDESLVGSCEEMDCGFRLWQAGARFRYVPQATVQEIYVKTPAELVRGAAAHGGNEWRLCVKHPEYRGHTRLRQLRKGAWWRRALRRAAVQSPVDSDPLLALLTWSAEHLRSARIRAAGVRLLGARMALAFFRGALREAGSWRRLAGHHSADSAGSSPDSIAGE